MQIGSKIKARDCAKRGAGEAFTPFLFYSWLVELQQSQAIIGELRREMDELSQRLNESNEVFHPLLDFALFKDRHYCKLVRICLMPAIVQK